YERTSTLVTSNRPGEDWGKLLGDSAAVTAMLDRLLHHGHILKCGPRSWRTKIGLPDQEKAGQKGSRPGPSHMAGFEVTPHGRICTDPQGAASWNPPKTQGRHGPAARTE